MTWESFQEGFRAAHIPSGVIQLKKEEFLDLRQDDRSVIEYMNEFNNLGKNMEFSINWSKEVKPHDKVN